MHILSIRFNTTGLLPEGQPIEVGAVLYNNDRDWREISQFHAYIKNEVPIHPSAQAAHNISADWLSNYGHQRDDVLGLFWAWLVRYAGVDWAKTNQLRILSHDTDNYVLPILRNWVRDDGVYHKFLGACAHTHWDTRQIAAFINRCYIVAAGSPIYYNKEGIDSCCLYDVLESLNYAPRAGHEHPTMYAARAVAWLCQHTHETITRDTYELIQSRRDFMQRPGYSCPWCGASAHSPSENIYECILCNGKWEVISKGE